jgi:hypothetical protein
MTDIFNYILFSIAVYIVFVIPSILFDMWLIKIGAIRYSNRVVIIIVTFLFVFAKPLLRGNVSWWVYGVIYILGILALNRSDLGETMKQGIWWWIPEKKKRRSNFK